MNQTAVRAVPAQAAPLRPVAGWAANHGTQGPEQLRLRQANTVPVEDWNALLGAVVQRLRDTATLQEAAPARLRAPMQDCAQALQLLQAALTVERNQSRLAERALARAQAELAATRHELLDTREGERRARHQAQHDSLTALPNRRSFSAQLSGELLSSAGQVPPLAVLFLDLDDFKTVNDQHGHQAGDRLLCVVADRLRRSVRAGDMVCRLGGDEFACLLQAPMGRPQLAQVARKLVDAISAPVCIGNLQLRVRPSIGIALCPEDGHTASALLHRADAAMYRAKRGLSGYAFFEDEGAAMSAAAAAG